MQVNITFDIDSIFTGHARYVMRRFFMGELSGHEVCQELNWTTRNFDSHMAAIIACASVDQFNQAKMEVF
tara:strand:- start:13968 stop:14177 length:210 start_codon:yes stop_codon:yes gene_type:complete